MTNIYPLFLCAFVVLFLSEFSDAKVKKKFGCRIPREPLYGSFKFNRKLKALKIVCEDGFQLIGTPGTIYCNRRKWNSIYFDAPQKTLNFHDNCTDPFTSSKKCRPLNRPNNGHVFTSSRDVGGVATFRCNQGYLLEGSEQRICYEGNIWSGEQPICRSMKTISDMASLIEDKMISKLSSATASSEDSSVQSKLAVGKSGLDIVLALDISSSIGEKSLNIAKDFIKLLVNRFNVSSHSDGGTNETRVALVTFSSKAEIVFNLNDEMVRSPEAVYEQIDAIKHGEGGGTNFVSLLTKIYNNIYFLIIDEDEERKKGATRAIFILTDAEDTSDASDERFKLVAKGLKEEAGFEIFTIGVGHTDKFKLTQIASEPYTEHVFLLNEMADLERMADIIKEKNIDYGQCGISGNTEIPEDSGTAKPNAWPWIGWVNVYDPESPKTCGGYLVCQRYFVTTATCVTKDTDDGNATEVDPNKVLVTLGDYNVYEPDTTEIQVRVNDIRIHPDFSGKANSYGVKDYDIALLDFGTDKTKLPGLSKQIRPICMAAELDSIVDASSYNSLLHLQQNWETKKGFTTGWGHKIGPTLDLPENFLRQSKRTVHQNKRCKKRYPDLDTTKFFCVGNREESQRCKQTDNGGPYMDQMSNKQYSVLGMALDTADCDKSNRYSIFLKTLRTDIVKWLGNYLSDCNRVEQINPTEEPPPTTTKMPIGEIDSNEIEY